MAKTFQEIQADIANIFRSTIDPDDMQLSNQNEEEYLNVASSCYTEALRMLNENDFEFNINTTSFVTAENENTYNAVAGQILENGITFQDNGEILIYDKNEHWLKKQLGKPQKYWFDNDENIVLFPTPNKNYNLIVKFKDMKYFLDENDKPQYTPAPTSTLKMPERLQQPFIEWLKYETLANYIKNVTKPRYEPIKEKAYQLKLAFIKLANPCNDKARMIL